MPFTLAHAAAAIPLRRTRLLTSAVVAGCFAPDFLFYLTLHPARKFGHTWTGAFTLDPALALLALWLFHRYAKEPLWLWMPESFRQRVKLGPRALSIKNTGGFALVLVSILVGIGTHMLWDSFTHPGYWPYRHWSLLSETLLLPMVGPVEYYKVFQYVSSVIGVVVILVWFLRHFRNTDAPRAQATPGTGLNSQWIFVASSVVAVIAGIFRAFHGAGDPLDLHNTELFVTESVVTTMSVFWLELVIYGILRARNTPDIEAATWRKTCQL